jgi:hypothetical protein
MVSEKIRKIEGQIMEEVQGSQEYLRCYDKWSNVDKKISSMYKEMSEQELGHAENLNIILDSLKIHEDYSDHADIIEFLVDMNKDLIRESKMMFNSI